MRLFLGLPIPPGLTRPLATLACKVPLPHPSLTAPENMHVTLYFLGQVPENRLPILRAELDQLHPPPLQLTIPSLGVFPGAGVLFAQVELAPALLQLQANVAARMARFALIPPPEDSTRDYRPHITLARTHQHLRMNPSQILPLRQPLRFTTYSVHLYQSHTTATGARYEIIHSSR
jgi:2'-5' RNA ligase